MARKDVIHDIVCKFIQENLDALMEKAKYKNSQWGRVRDEIRQVLSNPRLAVSSSEKSAKELAMDILSPTHFSCYTVEPYRKEQEPRREQQEPLKKTKLTAEERKLVGVPTDEQFEGYKKRMADIGRPLLDVARKSGYRLPNLMAFLRSRLGVGVQGCGIDGLREATRERWEATLAMMEATDLLS